ncbi:MAG: hypothetical protein HY823_11045 [Acidobacteria bacterium]|nr:hypothetical protein [Acidobacteriota bacterium]
MESLDAFLPFGHQALRHPAERRRLDAILLRWATAWQGPRRTLEFTRSHHGAYLHFNQLIGRTWCQVCTFHAVPRQGVALRGPDPDRMRKSHKLRRIPLDRSSLDAVFEAWSAHPEARPAGLAVELHLAEAPDEVWEAFLLEALRALG